MAKKELDLLLIEDSSSDAELIKAVISNFSVYHCSVTSVSTLKEAGKLLGRVKFGVILLDLNLPDSRGLDTVKEVIAIRGRAPVIIMTVSSVNEMITSALSMGAQNYIIKGEETPQSLERAIIFSIEREKNVAEIKKSKQMLEKIIDYSPVMTMIFDADLRTVMVNKAASDFNCSDPEKCRGKFCGDIIGCINSVNNKGGCGKGDNCPDCLLFKALQSVKAGGPPVYRQEITRSVMKNGGREEANLLVSAVKISAFEGERILVSVEDVTEVRQAAVKIAQSEEKFKNAFEQSAVGMVFTDLDGNFLKVNRCFCEITGYQENELEKMNFRDITLPETLFEENRMIEELLSSRIEHFKFEKRYKRKEGKTTWVELTCSATRDSDGKPKYFSVVVEDINARKQAEMEINFYTQMQEELGKAAGLDETYRVISGKISELIGSCITAVLVIDEETMATRVASYSGFDEPVEKMIKIFGFDPTKFSKKSGEMTPEERGIFGGEFKKLSGGLHTLMLNKAPKLLCDGAARILGIENIYTMGLAGGSIGGLVIMTSADITPYAGIIERTMKYASAVVKRKLAEAALRLSEERWSIFLDSAEDIMELFGPDLKLSAANKKAKEVFLRITGKQLEPGTGLFESLEMLGDTGRYEQYLKVMETGEPLVINEYTLNTPEGVKYFSLKAGKIGGGLGLVIFDITELKRSELILRHSYEKLKEADRIKSNFISIVSHELRTPLTVIKGFAAFLDKEAAGPLNEHQRGFVDAICANTERLSRIINDMVDMSKIENGIFAVEKDAWNLPGVVREAAEHLKHTASEHGVEIRTNIEPEKLQADIDKGRIIQTISNLVNNAVRFTPPGKTVTVGLVHADRVKVPAEYAASMPGPRDYCCIYVEDEGEGIEKEYLKKFFERFYQVENANTRKHQGSGLGLSIAKSIAEAHEGFIWAESEGRGKGTRISMMIPV